MCGVPNGDRVSLSFEQEFVTSRSTNSRFKVHNLLPALKQRAIHLWWDSINFRTADLDALLIGISWHANPRLFIVEMHSASSRHQPSPPCPSIPYELPTALIVCYQLTFGHLKVYTDPGLYEEVKWALQVVICHPSAYILPCSPVFSRTLQMARLHKNRRTRQKVRWQDSWNRYL